MILTGCPAQWLSLLALNCRHKHHVTCSCKGVQYAESSISLRRRLGNLQVQKQVWCLREGRNRASLAKLMPIEQGILCVAAGHKSQSFQLDACR
jgi:hypothetical protein